MITFFTVPKPFLGKIGIIQKNAILSWKKSCLGCEIILFGSESGIAQTAKDLDVLHIPEIKKNSFGTPYISYVFNEVQKKAKNNILVYSNTDIIFLTNIEAVLERLNLQIFLMAGRRWDLNLKEEIDFNQEWKNNLKEEIKIQNNLHGFCGIDYFIFPRNLPISFPPLTVGRPGWDNWFIYYIRSKKIPLIDATKAITAVHQNHNHSHISNDEKEFWFGNEAKENIKIAGDFGNLMTLRESDFLLTSKGLEKPGFLRLFFSKMSFFYPWKKLLSIKRERNFNNKKF